VPARQCSMCADREIASVCSAPSGVCQVEQVNLQVGATKARRQVTSRLLTLTVLIFLSWMLRAVWVSCFCLASKPCKLPSLSPTNLHCNTAHSFIHSLTHSFIGSFTHSLVRSFVRSFICSFVRFLTHQTNLPLGSALRSSLYGVLFVRMLVVKA